ncbi:class I SAM-dependent methyltransferase [[Mycobacterium] zoologicum]|uniref:class I SAM-dependent methyltransferase n=1 Tax=[Mycobacterium] zoologicum TaxID=2872311 RepID=UPI002BC59985|nr:class I SAM-dependent methyltransferase [Mycolicibacter sp. MYC101]MEB3065661.1 class I SAM-dependent methyltransferase [Mycolicibacter sp. MYC101]
MEPDAACDVGLEGSLDLRVEEQLALADLLAPKWPEFSRSWSRFNNPTNGVFELADGAVYYSMLTTVRPKRIVEVGSGFSSAIALDVRDQELQDLQLTIIDPNPAHLYSQLNESDYSEITIHRDTVQNAPFQLFDALQKGDILFIDSSHVLGKESDVNRIFFQILPRLRPGVIVHLHDIFYPFEYPDAWADWPFNEIYLLQAFLSYNNVFQIMFFNSWFWREYPDVVSRYLPEAAIDKPGSIWLQKATSKWQSRAPQRARPR